MWSARFQSHMNHVSVSPTDGNGPTQGQRKTLTRVGPCVGPFPSVGLTLTWFIWDWNLALHITLYSVNSVCFFVNLVMWLSWRWTLKRSYVTRGVELFDFNFDLKGLLGLVSLAISSAHCCRVLQLTTLTVKRGTKLNIEMLMRHLTSISDN